MTVFSYTATRVLRSSNFDLDLTSAEPWYRATRLRRRVVHAGKLINYNPGVAWQGYLSFMSQAT